MPIPGEDYLLRLRWTDPSALTSNILDLVTTPNGEPVALVAWQASSGGKFVQGGFSVIRFSQTGNIVWQSTHTLCSPAGDDCSQWLLKYGAITYDGDRFIVAGTIAGAYNVNAIESIAIGIDDGGAVAWCHRYQTTFSIGRAMGIVPLTKPGRFLIASRNFNETESWLYGIDRNGALTGLEMRFFKKFLQRLRALPLQGILVLGTNNDDPSHPLGSILNIDPTTAKPAWERTYDPGDGTTLRWCDAAEGKDITVIGNSSAAAGNPLVATLAGTGAPDAGNVRSSFRPRAGDTNIRLNGIANFPTPMSTSSICGEFNDAAWQLAIDDTVRILWQKKYNHGPSSATLTPILFPNANAIIAGGLANVPADPPRALLVQSQVAIGGPAKFACGEETKATFGHVELSNEMIKSPFQELAMKSSDWFVNQAPLIEVEVGCLP